MEILTIILGAIILILIVAMFVLFAKTSRKTNEKDAQFLQNDLANLRRDLSDLSENLAKNVRESGAEISENVDKKLELTQKGMSAQMENSRKIVEEITKSLVKLEDTNKNVLDTQTELKTLQNVLTNAKTRGNLGEYYLENVLGNVLAPGLWEKQYKFKNGEIVDAIVHLRDDKILPIDSKFSLEHYNRMIEAPTKDLREKMYKDLVNDLKTRINETSKYIRPEENTMDFAFMFIPSEALYYDTIVNNVADQDLIDYAFREKKVIIVSPTTLLAYLQTVMQGLRSLQIEEQAKEIQKRVGELGKHLANFQTYHEKLGNSLSTVVNHYNNSRKELGKIDKDVVKIAGGEKSVEALTIDKPRMED